MVHKIELNEEERLKYTASHFGDDFPFRIEPFVFDVARSISEDYTGGFWNMFELDNGGFYMAPAEDNPFHVSCMNGYVGKLSADAFGITVCLYAYSNLSFSEDMADVCAEHFHLLREYMLEHAEVRKILSAID